MITLEKIEFRKKRDFSDKINATFAFVRENFKLLLKCILFIAGPFILIGALFFASLQYNILSNLKSGVNNTDIYTYLAGYFIFIMAAMLFLIAVVNQYIVLYMDNGKEDITVEKVWNGSKKLILKMLGAIVIGYFMILAGMLALVIPGIYITFIFPILFIIMARENIDIFSAIKRTFYLTWGKWWSTFGLIMVMLIIQFILLLLFYIPINLLMTATNLISLKETTEMANSINYKILTAMSSVLVLFIGFILSSLTFIAVAFQYFNLVERKESVGILEEINTFGTERIGQNEENY